MNRPPIVPTSLPPFGVPPIPQSIPFSDFAASLPVTARCGCLHARSASDAEGTA